MFHYYISLINIVEEYSHFLLISYVLSIELETLLHLCEKNEVCWSDELLSYLYGTKFILISLYKRHTFVQYNLIFSKHIISSLCDRLWVRTICIKYISVEYEKLQSTCAHQLFLQSCCHFNLNSAYDRAEFVIEKPWKFQLKSIIFLSGIQSWKNMRFTVFSYYTDEFFK